jgi:hypothetical protein
MRLVGTDQHALRNSMRTGDDQIIRREIELFDRKRHQRQIRTIATARKRQPLDEGRGDRLAADGRAIFHEVDNAEQVCIGEALDDLLKHFFGAAGRDQPVMHDRHFHDLATSPSPFRPCCAV